MSEEDKYAKYRVSKRLHERWKEELKYPTLKGNLSFEDSYQRKIDQCMLCPVEEFDENVNRLFYSTPWIDDELWEKLDEYTEEYEISTPVLCCGVPVKAENIPANVQTIQETDYHKLFAAILACANRRALLIPKQRTEIIAEEED